MTRTVLFFVATENTFPDILQYESIPLISNAECSSRLANVGNALVSDSNICTLTDPPVTALCNVSFFLSYIDS